MVKVYKNKEWLQNKYSREEFSIYKIAKYCGVTGETIRCWLKKLNIRIRSFGEASHVNQANHCNLSQEATEWLNGELLGDGNLYSQSKYSSSFQYSSKYLEYCEYVKNTLKNFGVEQSSKMFKHYSKRYKSYNYRYRSRFYVELLPLRKKWYPESKKIVPRDIVLKPLTVRQWYIGDGNMSHPKKSRPCIILATCGFDISDVEWLVKQLVKLGFKAKRRPYQNLISISTRSVKDFLNYIGKCPTECYKYKFRYSSCI